MKGSVRKSSKRLNSEKQLVQSGGWIVSKRGRKFRRRRLTKRDGTPVGYIKERVY